MKDDSLQLARLAACDADLYRKRQQRAEIVQRLERLRGEIAALKIRGRRRSATARTIAPFVVEPEVREEDRTRYAVLVADFEADLRRSAPLLVQLAAEAQDLDRRRSNCLNALSPRIRAAYEARQAIGRLPAIACVDGRACGGCGRSLDAELSEQGHGRAALLICPDCHRLLYSPAGGD